MNVAVNGERRELSGDPTLASLLADLGLAAPGGIAVAVNARVVSRSAFASVALRDGDEIEIIRAAAGG